MRSSERLWHLAGSYGMGEEFMAAWVEGLETWEAARLMGVTMADVDDSADCSWSVLQEEMTAGEGPPVIWAGKLTGNWIQIVQVRGHTCAEALTELSYGGRAFSVSWSFNRPGELDYAVNGRRAAGFGIGDPGERWGDTPDALDPYMRGLRFDMRESAWEDDPELPPGLLEYYAWEEAREETGEDYCDADIPEEWWDFVELAHNGYDPAGAECRTSLLALVGRVTGRELDREWMAGEHTRYPVREPA
ncbi:DUF6461 domain-containing protein [Planomonospora venezuelensis]|uniref:Uncharacterized protein n=1 Tax=Planomonospora venezuelensis TaxID=1999 RepID=A0A841D6F9_PLAVE|nr:DUF6461 domain-containing protein [Planomonospora venezuelensis]MBB5963735.1 hypothetical protein [Planomonospora venezuelensis]GIN02152.1 hypothetical protein Pve01_38100 [Planomonospora venezuelensis]